MKKVVEFPDAGAIREEAAEWLIRLDGDEALDREGEMQLKAWLQRSQGHRDQLSELAELWGKMNVLTELAAPLERGQVSPPSTVRSGWRPFRLLGSAGAVATVVAMVSLGWSVLDRSNSTNGLYATAIGAQQSVTLSDRSIVFLNTDSQIRVDYDDEVREVHLLQGEAHFTVTESAERPFRVFAGTGRIEAVGTAFSVYLKAQSVDVTVTEGRVALATKSSRAPAIDEGNKPAAVTASNPQVTTLGELKAGQVATIEMPADSPRVADASLSNLRNVTERDLSRRVSWTSGKLVFSGKSLEEVVKEINRYTTVKIEFADPAVANISVGGLFPVGETEMMFEALETTFGIDVTYLSDSHVLLSTSNSP